MLAPHARSAPAAKATYAPLGAALRTNPDTTREGTFRGQSVLATAVRDQQQRRLEPAATPSAVLLRKVEPELPPPPPPPPPVTTLAPRPTVQPATGVTAPPAATDGAAAVHVPRDGGASDHTNNAPLRHTRDAPPRRCWPLFSISVGCSFGRVRVVASVGSVGPLARPSSSRWSPPLPALPAVSHAAAPSDAFALARAARYAAAAAVEQAPAPASPTSTSPTSELLSTYPSAAALAAAVAAINAAARDRTAAAARDRAVAAAAATVRDRERRSAALHAMRAAAEASPNGSPSRVSWLDLCAAMDEAARRAAAASSKPPGGATNVRAAAAPAASFRDGWSGPQALAGVSWHPLRTCALAPALAPAGYSPLDVSQRKIGDCYLLSSFASLAAVAPEAVDAAFITGALNDAGLLGVRFWVGEAWQWVWLDETLPCQLNLYMLADGRGPIGGVPNPASGKLGYPWGAFSFERAGAWPSILEKAWARLHGSYTIIDADNGRLQEYDAFGSFPLMRLLPHSLPGIQTKLADVPAGELWTKLRDWAARGWPMTVGTSHSFYTGPRITASGRDQHIDKDGIVGHHAFSLLRVFEHGQLRLLQLRNPWGAASVQGKAVAEWKGAFSDADLGSWTPALRAATGYDPSADDAASDGVFWMPLHDLVRKFEYVSVTPALRLVNDGGTWHKAVVRGVFAGRGLADRAHVFVSPLARCEQLHAVIVADGGDDPGRCRAGSGLPPTVTIEPRLLAGGAPARALEESDFMRYNFAAARAEVSDAGARVGVGVAYISLPVHRGAVAFLVQADGGGGGGGGGAAATATARGFTLTVCAEVPFELRVATPGAGVGAPVSLVSDVAPGVPAALPPVPALWL